MGNPGWTASVIMEKTHSKYRNLSRAVPVTLFCFALIFVSGGMLLFSEWPQGVTHDCSFPLLYHRISSQSMCFTCRASPASASKAKAASQSTLAKSTLNSWHTAKVGRSYLHRESLQSCLHSLPVFSMCSLTTDWGRSLCPEEGPMLVYEDLCKWLLF